MSKYTLILDSSQLTNADTCEQMWEYGDVERLELATAEPKEAMNAGTMAHRLLDIYYKHKANGYNQKDCIEAALNFDIDSICSCGGLKEDHKPFHKNCLKYQPQLFPLEMDMRLRVRSRLRDYWIYYGWENDITPTSSDHVEVGFSEKIYEDAKNLFVLEGRIDFLGELQGLRCVVDHKTQTRAFPLFQKSIQFKNYAMVSGLNTLIINYIRFTQKLDKTTLVRDLVAFSKPELEIWKARLIKMYFSIKEEQLKAMKNGGRNTFNKRWSSCAGKYGPCPYVPLCELVTDELIEKRKKQLYQLKAEWKPW